jgi:hypothetical protein
MFVGFLSMNYALIFLTNIFFYIAHIAYISFGKCGAWLHELRPAQKRVTYPCLMRLTMKRHGRWYKHREINMLGGDTLLLSMMQKKQNGKVKRGEENRLTSHSLQDRAPEPRR